MVVPGSHDSHLNSMDDWAPTGVGNRIAASCSSMRQHFLGIDHESLLSQTLA
jgi:hypothetical protein